MIEAALRDKVLPGDFRFPMKDARLALARLCALDGRHDEASQWFAKARVTLDAQGARPLRAIVDFDEALMHRRAGRRDAARPLLDAAVDQFARLGMTGWLRRVERGRRRDARRPPPPRSCPSSGRQDRTAAHPALLEVGDRVADHIERVEDACAR